MRTKLWAAVGLAATLALGGCETLDHAGLGNLGGLLGGGRGELSLDTVVAGLKEALSVGTRNAVAQTSKPGGYALNPQLRLPLPKELQGAANTLRTLGLGALVDNFEVKMNQAAEAAAAQAAPVFVGAIQQMTFADARQILNGGDTAATQYFREKTTGQLRTLYRPVVQKYTDQSGAAAAYKSLTDRYNRLPLVPKPAALSLDDYVTDQALNGLFTVLAGEEAKIRHDPAARASELLKTVFGR